MKAGILENNSVQKIEIVKVKDSLSFPCTDDISVEEPLEIRVSYQSEFEKTTRNISVTMRTPGNDAELAVGFLFTEGIISDREQVKEVYHSQAVCSRTGENTVIVELTEGHIPKLMNTERNFYTTSSCGVCGKGSIESIRTVSTFRTLEKKQQTVTLKTLYQLSEKLRTFQNNFSATGGIHASGLFDLNGNLLALREDVGRHNALDKLIGNALMAGQLPLSNHILLLSGRASFELIQKAAMAGIYVVAAIGAPSSLAVDLAKEFDMTLLGFLRDTRFNVYHQSRHVEIKTD
ncbi:MULTISPECIES: formate dehydrogenase accessory sulfurtransferase FdhD [Chryseobacterium]|uniref:Sulfur carrier protein FdhD n=1 Tax=Chryseobacterium camelliae TaxID=1265445 RepID=A0ABU0TIN8_9FLAO|nr:MULTISPECIES: formate dehydrogenase accessory sulfurtransferase FdhD [Chryseobacterium]MDT3409241.1 FdhD protein [Pseudacidovorax intermedius]MDQ1096897.1 FdhD protein [Chryseobacterium camelliae]MDQ1100839.1 FdhD protein [Chryseobacterium sp. SORGH_AS_1048]MDR6084281.1 FdhD protein [Chryseobacterium sp. SORGH_AS_0909]MDR6132552.1 FdhD protein [Chryseobacterium sp. SORGH_AS_1175]